MPALVIVNYDVVDADALSAYREPAVAALIGDGRGSVRAVTDETVDLGEGNGAGATTVILEYSSVDEARRVWGSDAYQAVIGDRIAATVPSFAIIVPI